jgi:redox-regulated HSP33 family molecular chaperone
MIRGINTKSRIKESEVAMKKRFKFDDYEIRILIVALNELRNQLIREERYTDAVDELLVKLFD